MKLRANNSGFTLLELIVVIAIMAIVGAILVPNYIQYVDKARNTVCDNAKTEFVHYYELEKSTGTESDFTGYLRLATQDCGYSMVSNGGAGTATIKGGCPSGGTYTISYSTTTGEISSVTCSEHDTTDTKEFTNFSSTLTNIISANKNINIKKGSQVDSGSTNSANTKKILSVLKDQGVDLGAQGVSSWSYVANNNGVNTVLWTSVDISAVKAGTKVPIMRYNSARGTYTVWYSTVKQVKENGVTYNRLTEPSSSDIYTPSGNSSDEAKKDPANAQKFYDELLAKYNTSSTK